MTNNKTKRILKMFALFLKKTFLFCHLNIIVLFFAPTCRT